MEFDEPPYDIHDKASHICDGLYIGSAKASNDLEHLTQEGITVIIRVITPGEHTLIEHPGITYHHYETFDGWSGNIIGAFEHTKDIIRNSLREGRRVLVHCRAGISRSAAVVVAYLMWTRCLDYSSAYEIVQKSRCIAAPCFPFIMRLHEYQMPTCLD